MLFDRGELPGGESGGEQAVGGHEDRVVILLPVLDLGLGSELPGEDPLPTPGLELEEVRTGARPHVADRGGDRLVGGLDVVAVDLCTGEAVAPGEVDDLGRGMGLADGGGDGVSVVDAGVEDREVPDGGHVEALVELAPPDGAVPDDGAGDPGLAPHLPRQRDAEHRRHVRPLDRVVAEVAHLGVGRVEAAALPPAHPGGLAEQLGHDPFAVPLVAVLGERVDPVAAMVGEEAVGGGQVVGEGGLCGLLAEAGVEHARDVALLELPLEALFEGPDEPHVAIEVEQPVAFHRSPSIGSRCRP